MRSRHRRWHRRLIVVLALTSAAAFYYAFNRQADRPAIEPVDLSRPSAPQ